MAIVFAMLAAFSYGSGDFLAGLAARRLGSPVVTAMAMTMALVGSVLAVLLFPGEGSVSSALFWGGIAGLGSGIGTLLLYHGLTVGRMSIVATLSGLLAALIPAVFGIVRGDALSAASAIGIAVAIPAIALVSWQSGTGVSVGGRSGAIWGFLGGIGFGVFFIALGEAGGDTGAWPIVGAQIVGVLVAAPFAVAVLVRREVEFSRRGLGLGTCSGVLTTGASIFVLAATNSGQLAVVAVLTSLYPGITAVLARIFLAEHWSQPQKVGLAAALAAVVLVSLGSA